MLWGGGGEGEGEGEGRWRGGGKGGAERRTLCARGVEVWAPGLAPQLAYIVVSGVTTTMP